ncbi:alpha/beta hydrolase [Larkinella soli]|uniref:alpha/beta hydrolase n=1 Tax=Larkinella soli TaxID=1770527 RepID=UPI000FFC417F|nr:alpha/beta hydrolase [Larkinella soli]
MSTRNKEKTIVLEEVRREGTEEQVERLALETNVGTIRVRYHPAPDSAAAVIWVGGAGGGLDGPAGGMYPRLSGQLTSWSIASLRLDYRFPNDLENCVIDTLVGVQFLRHLKGHERMGLVGHSFGGAVVISAGALSEEVAAVVALSSQTHGTDLAAELSPKPLLLLHGTADEILPDACSRQIYGRAREPKEIRLYEGCRHGLDECRQQIDRDLTDWLVERLQ